MTPTPRLAFLASPADEAQQALAQLVDVHGQHDPADADVLVALGGDGFMLQTLHRHGGLGKPVFGMKLGTVGFLMNHHRDDPATGPALLARIAAAEPAVLPAAVATSTPSHTSSSRRGLPLSEIARCAACRVCRSSETSL